MENEKYEYSSLFDHFIIYYLLFPFFVLQATGFYKNSLNSSSIHSSYYLQYLDFIKNKIEALQMMDQLCLVPDICV